MMGRMKKRMEGGDVAIGSGHGRSLAYRLFWWTRQLALLCLLAGLVLAFAAIVVPNRITVTVVNRDSEPLRSAVVHVTGNDYPIGDLAPGASASVFVQPRHDSHVELSVEDGSRLVIGCYLLPQFKGEVRAEISAGQARLTRCDMKIAWI